MESAACEAVLRKLLDATSSGSGAVRELLRAIQSTPLGKDMGIVCTSGSDPDDERTTTARAYFAADALSNPNPRPPDIVLVATQLKSARELEHALVHELVHALDHVNGMDMTQCDALACSEVRANGKVECGMAVQPWSAIGLACGAGGADSRLCLALRRRCTLQSAVRATGNVFGPDDALASVHRVFDQCHNPAL